MLTSNTLNTRRQQRGITLIEVSIGLIIAAIIAAAAFIAFQNNSRRAEIRDNVRQITEIVSETKQKVGITSGYAGFTTQIAVNNAILEGPVTNNAVANSYGPGVTLVAGGTADTAILTWPGVPDDQCRDLVLGISEGVNTITGTGTGAGAITVSDGVTLAEADTACGTGDVVSLAFEFGRR